MNEKYYILIEMIISIIDGKTEIKYVDETSELIYLGTIDCYDKHTLFKFMNDKLDFKESTNMIPFKYNENELKEYCRWFDAVLANYEHYGNIYINHLISENNIYVKMIKEIIKYKYENKREGKDAYFSFLKVENDKIIDSY